MISVYSVLYTLVLFSELNSHLVTVAVPATKGEDGIAEQDGLGLLLAAEPMTEPAHRQSFVMDNNVGEEDENPKIIIVSDMRLKGHSIRGLKPGFARGLPPLADQSLSRVPAEHSFRIDRRNTDLDVLRCMIGRVYRPCWEA